MNRVAELPAAADEATERLRRDARLLFAAGVEAADPRAAVIAHLELGRGGMPVLAGAEMKPGARLHLMAIGKAACSMMAAAREVVPAAAIEPGSVVVVNEENCCPLSGCRVYRGGHPVPNPASVEAARNLAGELLLRCGPDDGVLVLISGGGSSLLAAPLPGLVLAHKVVTTELLLDSGATIQEVNIVRKHLSSLKGGGLARLAAPARLEALILSDVVGDDLSSIASGPTVADPSTYRDALEVLERYALQDRVPGAVLDTLRSGAAGDLAETPKPGDPVFLRVRNRVVGSNRDSVAAVAEGARAAGYEPVVLSAPLTGEARDVGQGLAAQLELASAERAVAVLAGGETTVTVRGSGRGGRNQELALAFAAEASQRHATVRWALLSGGTDGRDGPTDAAGAVVDSGTVSRGEAAGHDYRQALANNDAHGFLAASRDLLPTGATGTNVADLQILLMGRR